MSSVSGTPSFVSQLMAMQSHINVAVTNASNSIGHTQNVDETLSDAPPGTYVDVNIAAISAPDMVEALEEAEAIDDILLPLQRGIANALEEACHQRNIQFEEQYRSLDEAYRQERVTNPESALLPYWRTLLDRMSHLRSENQDLRNPQLVTGGCSRLKEFVQKHKYDPHYEDVWCTTAGLLKDAPEGALGVFFSLLESGPRDLLGIYQQRLIMRCLHAGREGLSVSRVQQIERDLMRWINIEIEISGRTCLGEHPDFPKDLLLSLFKSTSEEKIKIALIQALANEPMPPTALDVVVPLLEGNTSYKLALIEAVERQLLTGKAVPKPLIVWVKKFIKDKDKEVREAAIKALTVHSEWTDGELQPVIDLLTKEKKIGEAAIELLSQLPILPDAVFQKLVHLLESKDVSVRQAACSVLCARKIWPAIGYQSILSMIKGRVNSLIYYYQLLEKKLWERGRNLALDPVGLALTALGMSPSWPDNIHAMVVDLLKGQFRSSAIQALSTRDEWKNTADLSNNPEWKNILQTVIDDALQDEDQWVSQIAIRALCTRPEWSDEILKKIINSFDVSRILSTWPEEMIQILGTRPGLLDAISQVILSILGDGNHVKEKITALRLLREPLDWPDRLYQSVADCLKDEDYKVKEAAFNALSTRPEWPDDILQSAVNHLKHQNIWLRNAALKALGTRPEWSDDILHSVADRLKDEDYRLRNAALTALGTRPEWPDDILRSVVDRLKDEYYWLRKTALTALGTRPEWPDDILRSVVDCLKGESYEVKKAAFNALGTRPEWPDDIFQSVADRLKDEDYWLRKAALTALGTRPEWSDDILQSVVERLKNKDSDAAIEALSTRPEWSDDIFQSVADHLNGGDYDVKEAALKALGTRPEWPDDILQSIVDHVKRSFWPRAAAIEALSTRHVWTDAICQAFLSCLKDNNESIKQKAFHVLGTRISLANRAIQSTINLLGNESHFLRQAAIKVLKEKNPAPTSLGLFKPLLEGKYEKIKKLTINELYKNPHTTTFYHSLSTLNPTFFQPLRTYLLSEWGANQHMPIYMQNGQLCFYTDEGRLESILLEEEQEEELQEYFYRAQEIREPHAQHAANSGSIQSSTEYQLSSVPVLMQGYA